VTWGGVLVIVDLVLAIGFLLTLRLVRRGGHP